MKPIGILLIPGVIGLLLLTGCSRQPESKGERIEVMLDSFEGPINSRTVDYGSSSDTRIRVVSSPMVKKCGRQSLLIDYALSPGGYMYCARGFGLDAPGSQWSGPPPKEIEWNQYTGISLQVYGSKRGNIAFDVKDNGGELHRFMIDDDFSGWREIIIPFTAFKAREDWQPGNADGNKTLDFPIWSFQFEPKMPGEGKVYFDCVMLIKE